MFDHYPSTPGYNDRVPAESVGVDEHPVPEPLEHWSEQDFDDLVPSWGKA